VSKSQRSPDVFYCASSAPDWQTEALCSQSVRPFVLPFVHPLANLWILKKNKHTLMQIGTSSPRDIGRKSRFLPRDAMHKRGLCRHAVSVCLSVRLSVTFVYYFKRSNHILNFFHHSSFTVPNFMAIFRRGPGPLTEVRGVECRWDRQTSRFSTNICLWHRWLLDRRVSSTFERWS